MVFNHFLHQFPGHLIQKKVKSNISFFSPIEFIFSSFFFSSKCKTMNNHILCINNDELSIITIPITIDDTNIITRQIKFSNKIEQINILYESNTQSILSIKLENFETKIYQFNKKETTTEWNYNELDIQIKSNAFYSITTEKNLVGQQLLEALTIEQKLKFYVSNINDENISNKRSYSVELPENMGGIEYLSYSIVRHTQLVTLRMQDASLLVIKLTENGGKK